MSRREEAYTTPDGEYTVKNTKGLDLAAKIVSIIIAFIIWLYAISANSPVYERSIQSVPVAVENVPTGLSVISGLDHTIDIKVKGKRSEVLSLTLNDIVAYVDASASVEPGLHTLPVSVTLPSGMSLSDKYPETVTVYLDNTTSKQIPISINLRNYTIDTDCTLESTTPELSFVTVKGPADELSKIKEAQVTIEPGYITSSKTASGSVTLKDNDGNTYSNPYVSYSETEVLVRIEVHKYKTVPLTCSFRYGYYNENNTEITLQPSEVMIKGSTDVIDGIESVNVATIDETGIASDITAVYPLDLPDGITAVNGTGNVTVSIKHTNTTTRTFAVKNIKIINGLEDKEYELLSDTVNVTLRGTISEYFTYFDSDDITVVIDMKSYASVSGDVSVPAHVEINNASSELIYAIGSYSVNLNVSDK